MENNISGKIQIQVDKTKYNLNFERYYLSDQIERIRVFGKSREILLQSDRPFLKRDRKRKAVNWKIISKINPDIFKNAVLVNTLLINLEDELEKIDFPKDGFIHYKNMPGH